MSVAELQAQLQQLNEDIVGTAGGGRYFGGGGGIGRGSLGPPVL